MPIYTPQRGTTTQGETVNVAISWDDLLDAGETITGTPTITSP